MNSDDTSIMADSQENLVEVYTKKRFWQKRTTLEKHLVIAVIILLILFLVFFVLYLIMQQYYYQLRVGEICTSSECIESALIFLQSVNFSQDPCEDFYNFACGNFGREHPIGDSFSHNSWFLEKEIRLNRLVQKVLETPIKKSDLNCINQTKMFYRSCVNETELDRLGLEPLLDLLELVQLPRTIPTTTEAENFNLGKTLALAQRHLSQDILVTITTAKTGNQTETNKNATVLKLSPSATALNPIRQRTSRGDIFMNELKNREKEPEGQDPVKRFSSGKIILVTIDFISDILREITKDMDQSEFNSTELVATAYKIMTFSSELVKDWYYKGNGTTEEQYMTFSSLQSVMDDEGKNEMLSNKIDWKEYVSTLLENVNVTYNIDSDIVVVEDLEYFKFISKILGEAKPVSIQRYVWWKLIEEFGRYTTSNVRLAYSKYSRALYGESSTTSRQQTCALLMRNLMSVALSHQMALVNNFSTTVPQVRQMLKDIENVFSSLVSSVSWIDPETKSIILDKAQAIKDEIGYSLWMQDSEKVDKFYKKLELEKHKFLKNIMKVKEWEVEKVLLIIGPDMESQNDTFDWFSNPLQVNAYYSRLENTILIPPGVLQTPFYFRGLESLNYGAIGSILGHELTHGFDSEGKNYNKFGEKLDNIWPEEVLQEYENKTKCFIQQYDQFRITKNKKLNGMITLAENIADNGGMRESFRAYKLYKLRHGNEPKLPGFEHFSHEQLLFLSFANIWCEETTPRHRLQLDDNHSPHDVRVLATLQNMKEFSEAYNCPPGSFMNPVEKCIIW